MRLWGQPASPGRSFRPRDFAGTRLDRSEDLLAQVRVCRSAVTRRAEAVCAGGRSDRRQEKKSSSHLSERVESWIALPISELARECRRHACRRKQGS